MGGKNEVVVVVELEVEAIHPTQTKLIENG